MPTTIPGRSAAPAAHADVAHRLDRLASAEREAQAVGDRRRALRLALRRQRVAAAAERLVGDDQRASTAVGADRIATQASLPSSREAAGTAGRRDYAALAPLAGITPAAYEALDHRGRLAARLAIDRELDGRRPGPAPAPAQRQHDVAGASANPRKPAQPVGPAARRRDGRAAASESPVLRRERQFAAWRAARTSGASPVPAGSPDGDRAPVARDGP